MHLYVKILYIMNVDTNIATTQFNPQALLEKVLTEIKTSKEELDKTISGFRHLSVKRITKTLLGKIERNPDLKDIVLSLSSDTSEESLINDTKKLFDYCEKNLTNEDRVVAFYGSMLSSFLDVLQTVIDTSSQKEKSIIARTLSEDVSFNNLQKEWKSINGL